MLRFTTGDMFKSSVDGLVNTVNCEGFMGKGIAYQFKLKYPETNKDYIKACKSGKLQIGNLHYYKEQEKVIINFPTKDKWREKSKISYIEKGLDELALLLPKLNIKSIALPPLGCGNGGLEWGEVKQLITNKLKYIEKDYDIIVYEPSIQYKQVSTVVPQLSTSSLVLMQIKMNLNKINALRLQKTAFFSNVFSGEEYFKFDKYKYGPYAHSIDIVSRNIGEYQNYYSLKNTEETYEMAYKVLCSDKTNKILEKLEPSIKKSVVFVNGIENDKDLEGFATIVYLVLHHQFPNYENIISEFRNWSEDKSNRFSDYELYDYINYLQKIGFIYKDIIGNIRISEYINN